MNGTAVPTLAAEAAATPDSPSLPPKVSVVMVVYMTGAALEESLSLVLADPLVGELVVVDNGSSAEEARCLNSLNARDAHVSLLSGHGNIGFARAANLGADKALGEVLVFLNPDAFLQPGCIAELAREIAANSSPCIVGGRLLNADRTEQRGTRRGDITPVSALLSLSGLARLVPGWRRFDVHWDDEDLPSGVMPAPTISGACFGMRREAFKAVGGFDEKYFLHVEDVDLCWRVRRAGGQVLFHPKAEVIHLGHTSLTNPLKVEFHKGVGLARYFRKRAENIPQRLLAWLLSPLVIGVALARPVLWRLQGKAA